MRDPSEMIARVERALPPVIVNLLRHHPHLRVAGGFVRDVLIGVEPKDVDVFVVGKPQAREWAWNAAISCGEAHDVMQEVSRTGTFTLVETSRAYTLHPPPTTTNTTLPPLQFVRQEYGGVDALFRTFDLSVCRVAFGWVDDWCIESGERFWADLADRRLRFCAPVEGNRAASTTHRLARFMARGHGWHFKPEDLAALTVARLKELKIAEADTIGAKWLQAPGEGDNSRGSG